MQEELSRVRRSWLVNPFARLAPKEWWYFGVHDPVSGTYLSCTFFRMAMMDSIHVAMFQPTLASTQEYRWKGTFGICAATGSLRLQVQEANISMVYERTGDDSWSFRFHAPGWDVELDSRQTQPAFLSRETIFEAHYGLLHHFGNRVQGEVRTPHTALHYDQARSYCDHAWGVVPRATAWYWMAVQNDKFCIGSIVNQGELAQRYTQILALDAPEGKKNEWVRLDPLVAYWNDPDNPWGANWAVTSTDLDLQVEILQRSYMHETIPPLVPVVVDLHHTECFVRVWGRVRVDGKWRDSGDLFGVIEDHHGYW